MACANQWQSGGNWQRSTIGCCERPFLWGPVLLFFVSLTLVAGFDWRAQRWHYAHLFALAWRNGIVLVAALAMCGLAWGVLWAGASLMVSIGVESVKTLIERPVFVSVYVCIVFSAAVGLGLARTATVEAMRRYLLSLTAWLLPLVLLFAVMWVGALPFTGLAGFLSGGSSQASLLWSCIFAIVFAASAFHDGVTPAPFPPALRRVTQRAWLAVVPVLAVALWALGQRIAQDGWNVGRIWIAFAALVVAVHVLGYAASAFKRGAWLPSIATTDIVGAMVLCLGLMALLSPAASAQRRGVILHLGHAVVAYQKDAGTYPLPEFSCLSGNPGRFERDALVSIAESRVAGAPPDWTKKAQELIAQKRATDREEFPVVTANTWDVHPAHQQLPKGFVSFAEAELVENQGKRSTSDLPDCLFGRTLCAAWVGDLNDEDKTK